MLADADDSPRRTVHTLRDAAAPLPRSSLYLLCRKRVQSMHRDNKWQPQLCAQQHRSMSAWQRRMRVNEINLVRTLQFAHTRNDPGIKKSSRRRKAKASWQGKVT